MHPYLPHLLSDIAAAHCTEASDEEQSEEQSFEQHIEEVERYLEGKEPDHTFGYYCGLESINFPPPEQLTAEELQQVCIAFQKMMASWNADISLPENFPLDWRYRFLTDTLQEGFSPVSSGFITFDYCTGYAPECKLKEYCPCLKFWEVDDTDSPQQTPDELPF